MTDDRIHSNIVKIVFRGHTVDVSVHTLGPTHLYTRVYSRDPLFLDDGEIDFNPKHDSYPLRYTDLGREFYDLFKKYNDDQGYAGLSPQEYIDKLGFRDP